MAFFLESTFVGLFFFGWDRLGKCTGGDLAGGARLEYVRAVDPVANGWMQNPIASEFNFETMRMEMVSFSELVLNPVAQVKFVHTVAAGYTTGAMFILGISARYLLKGATSRLLNAPLRSLPASVWLPCYRSSCWVTNPAMKWATQKTKLAAIEAEWETQPAPAAFTLFGVPDQATQENKYAIQIPYLLGLIATRSVDTPVTGLKDLLAQHEVRIRNGMKAYALLNELRAGSKDPAVRSEFETHKQDPATVCCSSVIPRTWRTPRKRNPAGNAGFHSARGTTLFRLPHHGAVWRAAAGHHCAVVLERDS